MPSSLVAPFSLPASAFSAPAQPLYAGLAASLRRLIEQDTLRPGR